MKVASVWCSDGEWRTAVSRKDVFGGDTWVFEDGLVRRASDSAVRPVVVIDPDDDESLSRLWRLLPDNLVSIDQMQAALREFANPRGPKPEEPMGLGAVVEDVDKGQWIRSLEEHIPWYLNDSGGDVWRDYAHIDAVRVLSPGVTD